MTMTEKTDPELQQTTDQAAFQLPADALDWCKRQVAKARQDRIPFERSWYINLAFFAGRQWIEWAGNSGDFDFARLAEPPKKRHITRLTSNKIRTRMLRTMSKLSQERPRSFVQPSTSDNGDIAGSKAAEKIVDWVTTEQVELDAIMGQVDFWSVICGTGFIKDYWNPNQPDAAGSQGRIEIDAMSPFHVFVPDMEVQDIQKQPWVAHVCSKHVDEIEAIFNVRLEPTTTAGAGGVLNDKFMHSVGINSNSAKDAVIYYEMYVKPQGPNARFPDGVKICWANDQILYVEPGAAQTITTADGSIEKLAGPFINGQDYPITRRIHYPSGRFYGESPITDMISLQTEYNRARSQMIDNRNLMSNPPWLAQTGSIVNPKALDGAPGRIIQYTPVGAPPQPVEMPSLPSTVSADIQLLQMDLDEAAQNTEMSRGDAPGRVEAATAIAYLQEESDAIVALASRDKERALERLGQHILYYVNTYWVDERSFTVVGRNNVVEAVSFSQSSTSGAINFKVVPGSASPLSRSAKQALIMELLKMGAIGVGEALEYLALGDASRLYEEMQIDKAQAQRENVQMSMGEEVEVELSYNHITHIQIHDDFVKRQEFRTMPQNLQNMVRFHTYIHLQVLAQLNGVPLMMDPAQQQMAMQDEQQNSVAPKVNEVTGEPELDEMGQPVMEATYYINPMLELEYRRIFQLIVQNGGVAPMPTPTSASPGESSEQPPSQ